MPVDEGPLSLERRVDVALGRPVATGPAGHGKLEIGEIERVERGLAEVLNEADRTSAWNVPEWLIDGLTAVVNEYDRQLCFTRMEIVLRASDYLGKLVGMVTRDTRANDSHLQVAQ